MIRSRLQHGCIALTFTFTIALNGWAWGTVHILNAHLNGAQVVAPVDTPGVGFAELTVDDLSGEITMTGSYSGLVSPSVLVTLNGMAAPGENAENLLVWSLDPPGVTSGSMSGGGGLEPEGIDWMLTERTYILLRSAEFPGGEIRGQVGPIPEPGCLGLAALGALGLLRRGR